MKKIVPFSKDIVFNTNIYEINSISLEHSLKLANNGNIEGEFIITGDYKESEGVINNEPFIYNIPFNIELDSKYNVENLKIKIEDFNYDIDKNILKVNINVLLEGLEIEEIEVIDDQERKETVEEEVVIDKMQEELPCVLNNIAFNEDNYINYYVYIYRENDSLDNIIKKYNISKDELEEYNDLSSITIGSKIIIPNNE